MEVIRKHSNELEETKVSVRRELESEHHQKFSQVSKQIQTLQQTELESLRKQLVEEYSQQISDLEEKHKQILFDLQESHKLEITELDRKYVNMTNDHKNDKLKPVSEITPDVYQAMRADIDKLEEEKYNLRSMQILMKDLMKDLAKHYDLSEKQVKFLSDSAFLDSFSLSLGVSRSRSQFNTPVNTPYKYLQRQEIVREAVEDDLVSMNATNLTENLHRIRLEDTETCQKTLENMMSTVQRSNTDLEDLQLKLETIVTGSQTDHQDNHYDNQVLELKSSDFVGIEAGRLEVERSRLEVELGQALHRIQELEMNVSGTRQSLPRSDILSGHGEAGLEVSSLGIEVGEEIRDKAAKLLSAFREDERGELEDREAVSLESCVSVLGDLLVYSDNISLKVKERVEEVEQQLEVADKQLRSTRAFLEEQAVEREQEREEWDRRLALASQSRRSSKSLSRGDSEEVGDGEREDSNEEVQEAARAEALEAELSTAVDKIYELRDIIRGLEAKQETMILTETQQTEMIRDLKLRLEEALLSQQLVSQELEVLRSSTSDQDLVEHIRSLEEQLRSQTSELTKQRVASSHIQDIR